MMRTRLLPGCLIVFAALCLVSPSHAGEVKISVDSAVLDAGQGGMINVYIEGVGSPALLNFFNYQIQLSLDSGAGRFEIAQPSASDLANLQAEPSYVFSAIGSPYASVNTASISDTIIGGDSRPDLDNTVVPASSAGRLLLTRFMVTPAAGTLQPTAGSVFSIDLVPLGLTANDPENTTNGLTFFFFHDENTDEDVANGFSSSSGSITVRDLAAVPEPSTLLSLSAGLILLASTRLRRR